jgi:hypothetical protein
MKGLDSLTNTRNINFAFDKVKPKFSFFVQHFVLLFSPLNQTCPDSARKDAEPQRYLGCPAVIPACF